MIDPLGTARAPSQARLVGTVKRWVVEALNLSEDAPILVSELRCSEPGCPPVETIIALLQGGPTSDTLTFKLPKPLAEVTSADVAALRSRDSAAIHASAPPSAEPLQ